MLLVLYSLLCLLCLSRSSPSARLQEKKENRFEIVDDNVVTTQDNDCNCVCGVSNRRMRVVGGNVTRVNEFPWLAGLSKDGEFYCGAALMTRRHLLTAAHCVHGFDVKRITVVLSDHDRNDPNRLQHATVRRIKRARSHEFFDSYTFNNDIAVLEMEDPVEFDGRMLVAACLPTSELNDYSGRLAIVAGWGLTGERQRPSAILRKVSVPVWSKKDCYNSGYGEKRLSENMLCAGYKEGKRDACQGDSGGPLHMKTDGGDIEIIGVVSWGRGCGRPNLPGIYTKLGNYLDWIRESLGGECLCPPPTHTPRRV